MYYMKLEHSITDEEVNYVIGSKVFKDDKSDIVEGFVFDYNRQNESVGICLWKPIDIGLLKIASEDILYFEEKVNYEEYFKKMINTNPNCISNWKKIL